MNKNFINIFASLIVIGIVVLILYGISGKKDKESVENGLNNISISTTTPILNSNGTKTFSLDNFHGLTNIKDKFYFEYPGNWQNDGQYFSPQRIEYYDLYSVRAAFYFDLILADIFDQTEFKYQIDNSKRKSPDSHGTIDGEEFKRYDLIDYGSYGGDSAGRVIVYVGPKINIDNADYYLVFHWEEKPLTQSISGNDPDIFEKVVKSLKFTK